MENPSLGGRAASRVEKKMGTREQERRDCRNGGRENEDESWENSPSPWEKSRSYGIGTNDQEGAFYQSERERLKIQVVP